MGLHKGQVNNGSFKKGMTSLQKGKFKEASLCWRGGNPTCLDCDKRLSSRVSKRCLSCSNKAKVNSEEMKSRGLKGLLVQQSSKEPTSIEKIVYEFLKEQGIIFETQELINGKFLVDAYIPSLKTVIEVDGSYWHNLPKVMKKDKAENAYLTKCGYTIIRLPEEEVRNGTFKERIGY